MQEPEPTHITDDQTLSVDEFVQELEAGGQPDPEDYVRGEDDATRTESLRDLVAIELELKWKNWLSQGGGDKDTVSSDTIVQSDDSSPLLENYLERYPLLKQSDHLKWLVSQEIKFRTECGDSIIEGEYQDRFPDLKLNDTSLSGENTVVEEGPERRFELLSRKSELDLDEPFGPYELLEKIGEGGMGLVYKARQVSADRIVALKILRLDRLRSAGPSRLFLERFQTEARATSRIDHPGIVTVFDVGEVDGLPYYAMKFVEGENLDEVHGQQKLEQREAVRVIMEAARALQAAHNRGVLHRDLKPQNILIDREHGQVCLADFGLAKLIETDQSHTRDGDILGTPAYMSPEQARDSGSVTILADVYSLGACLYFLLTDQAPFTGNSALQILRQVVDDEVKPPTTIVSSMDSDLEVICLKALHKDPDRRYPTAAAFADDLERWLKGEPIEARPVGNVERVLSWCKRNPFSTSLIAVSVCSLIMTAVVAVLGYREVSRALAESEDSYRHARETVNDFFTIVSEDILLQQPSMQPLRRELLEKSLNYYRGFLERSGEDAAFQHEIADTYYRIGRIQELIETREAALSSFEKSEQLQRGLLKKSPDSRELQISLSRTLNAQAKCFAREGDVGAAVDAVQESHTLRKSLWEAGQNDEEIVRLLANAEMNLAILHGLQGRFDQARELYRESLARRRPFLDQDDAVDEEMLRDQGMCYFNLANLEMDTAQWHQAGTPIDSAIDIFERCRRQSRDDFEIRERLGQSYRLQGEVRREEIDPERALAAYDRSAKVLGELLLENPRVLPLRQAVGEVELLRGEILFELGKTEESLTALTESVRQLSLLPDELIDARIALIRSLYSKCLVLLELGDTQAGRSDLEQCITLLEALQPFGSDLQHLEPQLLAARSLLEELPPAKSIPTQF